MGLEVYKNNIYQEDILSSVLLLCVWDCEWSTEVTLVLLKQDRKGLKCYLSKERGLQSDIMINFVLIKRKCADGPANWVLVVGTISGFQTRLYRWFVITICAEVCCDGWIHHLLSSTTLCICQTTKTMVQKRCSHCWLVERAQDQDLCTILNLLLTCDWLTRVVEATVSPSHHLFWRVNVASWHIILQNAEELLASEMLASLKMLKNCLKLIEFSL